MPKSQNDTMLNGENMKMRMCGNGERENSKVGELENVTLRKYENAKI